MGDADNLGGLMRAQAPATDQDNVSRSQPLWYAGTSQLHHRLTKHLGMHQ